MKKLITIIAVFITLQGFTQSKYYIRGDSVFIIKDGGSSTLILRNSTKDTIGYLLNMGNGITKFSRLDSTIYTSIYANSLKLDKTDTTSLSNRINLKVNISDTAAMLSPYLKKINITAGANVTLTGSGTNGSPYVINSSAPGTGTVTNIATGYGLSGGPITTTGTIIVDSAALSLKYLRIADTANMRIRPIAGTNVTITGTYPNLTFNSTNPSALTRQVITTGSSATVTGGNYVVTIDPSSTIATFTLTMPASPTDMQTVEVGFGGTLTSGIVVTALTISPNSGQTIQDNTPPGSGTADDTIYYRYYASKTAWQRIKL